MTINKEATPYIVEELLKQKLISEGNKDKVTDIINGNFISREFKIKEQISKIYGAKFKGLITSTQLQDIYNLINSKFREEAELTFLDISSQVDHYFNSRGYERYDINTLRYYF